PKTLTYAKFETNFAQLMHEKYLNLCEKNAQALRGNPPLDPIFPTTPTYSSPALVDFFSTKPCTFAQPREAQNERAQLCNLGVHCTPKPHFRQYYFAHQTNYLPEKSDANRQKSTTADTFGAIHSGFASRSFG